MKRYQGQSTLEFTFGMILCALLIYGLIKTFQWAGMDYAEQAYYRDDNLPLNIEIDGDGNSKINPAIVPRSKRLNAFTREF